MNIILLGKSGLIGSAIYKKLTGNGHDVTSLGRSNCDYYLDLNNFSMESIDLNTKVLIYCAGVTDEEIKNNK